MQTMSSKKTQNIVVPQNDTPQQVAQSSIWQDAINEIIKLISKFFKLIWKD